MDADMDIVDLADSDTGAEGGDYVHCNRSYV